MEFNAYFNSKEFHDDYGNYSNPRFSTPIKSSKEAGNSVGVAGVASASGTVTAVGPMTAQEFRQGVKRDKAHYETLNKYEGLHDWNRGFVATAQMHYTHLVLDEHYVSPDDITKAAFKGMQIFMYLSLKASSNGQRKVIS
jgi:hypothetical protein